MGIQLKTIILISGLFLCGRAHSDPRLNLNPVPFSAGGPSVLVVADSGADSGRGTGLSLDDLGFTPEETRSDPQFQKDLDKRSDTLKIHQTLGMVTAVPMVATYILGLSVEDGGGSSRDLHAAFGIATGALYLTTASFAIFAPKPKGLKATGNSEIHRILAFVHFPLMIITPILGSQIHEGAGDSEDSLKGIHFACASVLLASYLTSMTIMTF